MAGSKQAERTDGRDKAGRFRKGVSGNPSGRRKKQAQPRNDGPSAEMMKAHSDGWNNIITGLGLKAHDNRQSTDFCVDHVNDELANELWKGDDIAARIIESFPEDMLREGFEIQIQDDSKDAPDGDDGEREDTFETKEVAEQLQAKWDDLKTTEKLEKALQFERAKGGGAIMLNVLDNAGTFDLPLDPARVREVRSLTVYEKRELTPHSWYTNPFEPKFGEPETWRITPYAPGGATATSFVVHESRLILFRGIETGREDRNSPWSGWGESVLTRVWKVLRDFNMAYEGAGALVGDFSIMVHKFVGLAEIVAGDNIDAIKNRLKALHLSRSMFRTNIIDTEEEMSRETTSVTGLPELLDRFDRRLAAAAEMPLTRLMGMSPGGMNATGESDIRFYYDTLSSKRRKINPKVEMLLRVYMACLGIAEPTKWSVNWRPLWQESDAEREAARKTRAETDAIEIANGVVTPEEVSMSRYGGDEYSYETIIDFKAREQVEVLEPVEGEIVDPLAADPLADPTAEPVEGEVPELAEGAPTEEVQKTAMNGAQISGMLDVIAQANDGTISRPSAIAVLEVAFQLSAAEAEKLLGPEGFKPTKPEPPPMPPGFGGPPQPPGEPEPDDEEDEEPEPDDEEDEEPEPEPPVDDDE